MDLKEVPQDKGAYGEESTINYAVSSSGRIVPVGTRGWQAANDANALAIAAEEEKLKAILADIAQGRLGPLAYHAGRRMMTASILAEASGISFLRVRHDLRCARVDEIPRDRLQRYADALEFPIEELGTLPGPGTP